LEEHGMVGRPTLEKCKKLRIKNDTMKEIQELDTKSIISESKFFIKLLKIKFKINVFIL
jgi:hypothetical protein